MPNDRASRLYRLTFVLILSATVSAVFLFMIRDFLIDVTLGGIFAGLLYPIFQKSLPLFGNRPAIAAIAITILSVIAVALPFVAISQAVRSDAIQLINSAHSLVDSISGHPERLLTLLPQGLEETSLGRKLATYLSSGPTNYTDAMASFLVRALQQAALGIIRLFFDLFVICFSLVCLLQSGPALVSRIAERIPLERSQARKIAGNTLDIMAATLKSIVIIGATQGVLIGGGFFLAGIGRPWFWGAAAAIASAIIPGLGSAIVWAPAAVYLMLTGHFIPGFGLAIWGQLSVFFGDNLLRIRIIRGSSEMPSLLVFLSTLGGIATFGPAGLLIGPMLAGLFLGVLDLYNSVLHSSGLLAGSKAGGSATDVDGYPPL